MTSFHTRYNFFPQLCKKPRLWPLVGVVVGIAAAAPPMVLVSILSSACVLVVEGSPSDFMFYTNFG